MDFQISVLPNGLRILTANMPSLESASVGFFVNAGSADENLEINGISHFLEHMAFKGTKTRTAKQISEEIQKPELFDDVIPDIYYHEEIHDSYKPFGFDLKKKLLSLLRGSKKQLPAR